MRSIEGERALRGRGAPVDVLLARPDRPRRCTLPITALRVMPPSSAAIWLADRPSDQSFLSSSTRSSVHDMLFPPERAGRALIESPTEPGSAESRPTHTYSPERFRRLSAVRHVVLDNKNATICRGTAGRVGVACVPPLPSAGG